MVTVHMNLEYVSSQCFIYNIYSGIIYKEMFVAFYDIMYGMLHTFYM